MHQRRIIHLSAVSVGARCLHFYAFSKAEEEPCTASNDDQHIYIDYHCDGAYEKTEDTLHVAPASYSHAASGAVNALSVDCEVTPSQENFITYVGESTCAL